MGIPVSSMHDDIRDARRPVAEKQIEADDKFEHPVAGSDAVRLAYVLYAEAGNFDLWNEAVSNWRAANED